MKEYEIKIYTEIIKLQELIKFSGLTETGGEAKQLILEREIFVNGELCAQRGKKLRVGDKVVVDDVTLIVV
ncbi:MAG: RNA-binding S4 domain-containing protein [Eubacteriales bacterium]